MNTYVIGDIHGALKALEQILERAPLLPTDKLIFLGDYVDGWSESAEVIQRLIELSEEYECIFLRGNHDKWCQDWLLTGNALKGWTEHGGKATLDSYIKTSYLTEDSHKKFFRMLHNYYVDEDNNAFVHGGFSSRLGVGHEPYESNYYWNRDLWNISAMRSNLKLDPGEGQNSAKRMYKHKEIFIGHTATVNYSLKNSGKIGSSEGKKPCTEPLNACNVWNVDTGAGFAGKLTIMDIKTKEFWQSDLVKDLYPHEKGR